MDCETREVHFLQELNGLMAYQNIDGVLVWGNPDEGALAQARTCSETGNVVQTLLMADHHKGYSQPIGGVVVYDRQISPSSKHKRREGSVQ